MIAITLVTQDGTEIALDVEEGQSLMEAAVQSDIAGIVGECGGSLLCATCHVYVEGGPLDALPPRSEDEEDMLDLAMAETTAASRLSCQLIGSKAIEGLVVRVPSIAS